MIGSPFVVVITHRDPVTRALLYGHFKGGTRATILDFYITDTRVEIFDDRLGIVSRAIVNHHNFVRRTCLIEDMAERVGNDMRAVVGRNGNRDIFLCARGIFHDRYFHCAGSARSAK